MNFTTWYDYFIANQSHFDHLDWSPADRLTEEEKKCIYSSVQQFQRGEHSEGKHFLQYAESMQDKSYTETVKVFIREEQDHARVLGQFMDAQGITRLRKDWLDGVFRGLRKLAGLEGTVTVLLTAEIIAIPYYTALERATKSTVLRQICKQILKDEEMHLRFQSYTLWQLYQRKIKAGIFFSKSIHRVLMAGTLLMVWMYHRKVLRAGNYDFGSFMRATWFEFNRCRAMTSDRLFSAPVRTIVHSTNSFI